MIEQEKKGFLVLMALLGEAFKEEVSTERAKIYFEFLKPYSFYSVMNAIKHSIRYLKFYPKVSELIDIISPHDQYPLIESEEAKKFRLKRENQEITEFITQISKIIGKTELKQIK